MNPCFSDPNVSELMRLEQERQHLTLRLIASENYVSSGVLSALSSPFVNKSTEGYRGARYHEGQELVDALETLAIDRAKSLFSVEHANVQPYSGSLANLASLSAFLAPEDTFMAMDLSSGGHLSHGASVSWSGRFYKPLHYGVRKDTETVDLDQVRSIARRECPKLIICGGSSLPRLVDYRAFSEIAMEVGAICLADISHPAGLIAARVLPSPIPLVDVITTTTHKTLRGPRGAMIMCRAEYARLIDRSVFPGLQAAAHDHTTAAIAVALYEANTPGFRDYATTVVHSAKRLAEELMMRGFRLVSGGTDTHLILADVSSVGLTGRAAARALSTAGIESNANKIPFDPASADAWRGLRLGTAGITSRGIPTADMPLLASWIDRAIRSAHNESALMRIKSEIAEFLVEFSESGRHSDLSPRSRRM